MTATSERRYAEALLDAVWNEPPETRQTVAEELRRLAGAAREVPDLRNALENPSYSLDERLDVVKAVSEQLELSERTRKFARLVVERGRAAEIGAMSEAFDRLLDERAGRVKAKITSASALDEDAAAKLKKALERRTGKTVELDLNVDPSLIGGVRAEVGSTTYDGSIRAELAKLRERLTQRS